MRNVIIQPLLLLVLALSAPQAYAAQTMMPLHSPWAIAATELASATNSQNTDEITIKAEGRKIHVSGAEDKTLEVYNIVGVKVTSYNIDAPEKTITLSVPRGIYILRVDKVARKVNIP